MTRTIKTPVRAAQAAAEGVIEVVLVHKLKIGAAWFEPGSVVELDAVLARNLISQGAVHVAATSP